MQPICKLRNLELVRPWSHNAPKISPTFAFWLIEKVICCKQGKDREWLCSCNVVNKQWRTLMRPILTGVKNTRFEPSCALATSLPQRFPPDQPAVWRLLWTATVILPLSAQSTNMAFGKVTEETVYTCTGHPLKSDIANILDWMLNQDFTTAYRSILSCVLPRVQ